MFRSTPAPDPLPLKVVEVPADDLVPLSVLALDLEAPSVGGWHAYLSSRDIAVVVDDVGRDAISRADARRLITERREGEARAREQAERMALENEAQRVASLRPGIPWYRLPDGVSPAGALMQAGYEAERPRSVYNTLLDAELAGRDESLVYHSLREGES